MAIGREAQKVYDDLRQSADDPYGDLYTYVGALADELLQGISDLVRDGDNGETGWSAILDIDRVPDAGLDYIAQFIGVQLLDGLTAAEKRTVISNAGGWDRGTVAAIQDAARTYLTGTKTVIVRERLGGDPYAFQVLTKTLETPPEDLATTNLHTQSSYETNASGVSAENANTSVYGRSSGASKDGTYGLALQSINAGGQLTATLYQRDGTRIPVAAGQVYTASLYSWMDTNYGSGKTVSLRILWYDAGSVQVGATVTGAAVALDGAYPQAGASSYKRPTVTGTAPVGAVTARLLVDYFNTVAGQYYWDDAVQFEPNPVATPFVFTDGAAASRPSGQGLLGAALRAAKPAGLIMTYNTISGNDYQSLLSAHPLYSNVFADYATYQGVLNDAPGT